jgi:hypothetical protein
MNFGELLTGRRTARVCYVNDPTKIENRGSTACSITHEPTKIDTSDSVGARRTARAARVCYVEHAEAARTTACSITHEPTKIDKQLHMVSLTHEPTKFGNTDSVGARRTARTKCSGLLALRGRHGWDPEGKRCAREHSGKVLPHFVYLLVFEAVAADLGPNVPAHDPTPRGPGKQTTTREFRLPRFF